MSNEKEREQNLKPFVGTKKLVKIGGSVYVLVPKEFLDTNELEEGDEVTVLANRDMLVSAHPETIKRAHDDIEKIVKGGELNRTG